MAIKASTQGKRCEKNPDHWLDPTWDFCPYCRAEQGAKQRSHSAQSSAASSSKRNPTQVSGGSQHQPRQGTKVMENQGSRESKSSHPARGKRIVAVLVTYNRPEWPEGRLFEIVEGRNYIGAGTIGSEAYERLCDILIEEDNEMSSEHAVILCRQGTFEIVDNKSLNNTYVNGKNIPTLQGYQLENYAEIKTGETIWTFIIIDPLKIADKSAPSTEQGPMEEHQPKEKHDTKVY